MAITFLFGQVTVECDTTMDAVELLKELDPAAGGSIRAGDWAAHVRRHGSISEAARQLNLSRQRLKTLLTKQSLREGVIKL